MWERIAQEFPVTWKARHEPLDTVAVAARGVSKCIIMDRLRRRPPVELAGLQVVISDDYLIILGEANRLPWASGAFYLGTHSKAPNLLVPTMIEPALPIHLFESVIQSRSPHPLGRIAVFPKPMQVVPIVDARPLTDEAVYAWLWNGRRRAGAQGAPATI